MNKQCFSASLRFLSKCSNTTLPALFFFQCLPFPTITRITVDVYSQCWPHHTEHEMCPSVIVFFLSINVIPFCCTECVWKFKQRHSTKINYVNIRILLAFNMRSIKVKKKKSLLTLTCINTTTKSARAKFDCYMPK